MGLTRAERIALHKKQERLSVKSGDTPTVGDLKEGVPVVRYVSGTGLVEFTKFKNVLYKKVLDRA